jgi:hypothetical protein
MLAHSTGLQAKIMLTIFCFLGAIVLAFRFNVLMLVPTMLLAWMFVLAVGMVTASSGSSILLKMVLVAVALQIGYLAGFVFKWGLLASRRGIWSGKKVAKARASAAPDGAF